MPAVTDTTSPLIGAYLTKGTIGTDAPGAPTLQYSLVVVPSANSVSGTVVITQAIAGPLGRIVFPNVKGVIRKTGFGNVTQIVALEGEAVVCVPPPGIGCYLMQLSAHMAIDNSWHGTGGFTYGDRTVENAPVNPSV